MCLLIPADSNFNDKIPLLCQQTEQKDSSSGKHERQVARTRYDGYERRIGKG